MRVTVFTAVLLLACCLFTDAWFWGRRRRSSSSSSGSGTTAPPRNKFESNIATDAYGRPTYNGEWSHTGDNWSGNVKGNIDGQGNWNLEGGVSFTWKKRSVRLSGNYFNITLRIDPCDFSTYDIDRNDVIVKGEMHAIFGNNEQTDALFEQLDTVNEDGVVDEDEFDQMAPVTIGACADIDEE